MQRRRGPLAVVWDGLNTHVSRMMADLVAARDWLTVFRLPVRVRPESVANLAKRGISQLTAL